MDTKRRIAIRPEWILAFVALLAAVGCAMLFFKCVPYILAERPVVAAPTEPSSNNRAIEPEELTALPTEPSPAEAPKPQANPYTKRDFQYNDHNFLLCQAQDSWPGIDVSAFQGEIDWEQVADSGIRFAIVRLGYRGWGKAGKMVVDEYAAANLEGARQAGLQVGAYFFSQALTIDEVDQEIDLILSILGDFQLDMPIVFDWEIPVPEARTVNMDPRTLTELQKHFCNVMSARGYQPMIYFNWNMSSNLLYLHELEDYPFWLALYQDRMTYPYRVEMWQYTDRGRVPGINGDVDINVYMP